jgi:anti-sigma regulatory factor (Ser/Thr protein kinase)
MARRAEPTHARAHRDSVRPGGYAQGVNSAAQSPHSPTVAFHHEALLYAGNDEFVSRCSGFIRNGLAQGEAILVAVARSKIDLLREALGVDATNVRFADMYEIGGNPARIIPVWHEFATRHAAGGARGIGEPISPARRRDELTECQRHEALINVAFDAGPPWRLACPYDTSGLEQDVIDEALRSHPVVTNGDRGRRSPTYTATAEPFEGTLPEPPSRATDRRFGLSELGDLRQLITGAAAQAGLRGQRLRDLVLAVNEVASNSVRHGGGSGLLRVWREPTALFCEVRDQGEIDQPLAGRVIPADGQPDGRGLWIANQVCDLVQIRSSAAGTVVRMQMRLPDRIRETMRPASWQEPSRSRSP